MSIGPIGPMSSRTNLLSKTEFSGSPNNKGSLSGVPITLVSSSPQRQNIRRPSVKERIFSSLLERISTQVGPLVASVKKVFTLFLKKILQRKIEVNLKKHKKIGQH